MENNEKQESLFAGIIKYSISTWANLIIGFLSVIITTRILLPDVYGMISIFLSATNFLMYLVTFGMDGAYIRFYNEPPKENTKNQILYKIVVISTCICIVFGVLCAIVFYKDISMYIFGIESRLLMCMVSIYVFSQAMLRYLNINFRMGFKVRQYNIQNIMISCLSRVLIIIAALFMNEATFIISVVSIGTAVILLIYLFIQRKEMIPYSESGRISFSLSLKHYSDFFRFALFSAPTYFVTYFNSFAGQQIIRETLGAYKLGVFSSCGMFSSIFTALKGGFATYWSAYVYKNHASEKKRIADMHNYVLLFAILFSSVLVMMRDIVFIVIGKEYHESKQFFSLLLLMPVLSFVLETTDKGIALAKKNEIVLFTHLVSAASNILGCIVLIPFLGIMGAAYANALSAIILYAANTIFGQKYYRTINNPIKSLTATGLIILLMFIPSFFNEIAVIIGLTFVLDLMTYFLFKAECSFLILKCRQYLKVVFTKKG